MRSKSLQAVTISSTYQAVIPKEVRKQFHLKPGQKIIFIPYNGTLRVIMIPPIRKACGRLMGINTENIREEAAMTRSLNRVTIQDESK
jgi:AbrB family looped-hinge helix DNA binding protein